MKQPNDEALYGITLVHAVLRLDHRWPFDAWTGFERTSERC